MPDACAAIGPEVSASSASATPPPLRRTSSQML
jgi:hypothetical protein